MHKYLTITAMLDFMPHTRNKMARRRREAAGRQEAEKVASAASNEEALMTLLRAQPLTTVFWLGRDIEAAFASMKAGRELKPQYHDALRELLPTASEREVAEEIKPLLNDLIAARTVRHLNLAYRDPRVEDRPYHYYFDKSLPRGRHIFLAEKTGEALRELARHKTREFHMTSERVVAKYILVKGGLSRWEADQVIMMPRTGNASAPLEKTELPRQQRFLRGGAEIIRDKKGRFMSPEIEALHNVIPPRIEPNVR